MSIFSLTIVKILKMICIIANHKFKKNDKNVLFCTDNIKNDRVGDSQKIRCSLHDIYLYMYIIPNPDCDFEF